MKNISKKIALSAIVAVNMYGVDANQACFYEHDNYKGIKICYSIGDHSSVGNDFNDKFSSVEIGSNVWIRGYEDINFGGGYYTRTSSTPSLGTAADNKISSVQIRSKNETPTYDEFARINLVYPDSSNKYTMCTITGQASDQLWDGHPLWQDTGNCETSKIETQFILTYNNEVRAAKDPRYCIDSGDTKEGGVVLFKTCNGSDSQKWYFKGDAFSKDKDPFTMGSLKDPTLCYFGGWANKGLQKCDTLKVSQNNAFYNIPRTNTPFNLNQAYKKAEDLQKAFEGYMYQHPKLTSAIDLSRNVTLDINNNYKITNVKIIGNKFSTPFGANLTITTKDNIDATFDTGSNKYMIAKNQPQTFDYNATTNKWTIPSGALKDVLDLNKEYTTQDTLNNALNNQDTFKNLFSKGSTLKLAVHNGFWIGNVYLPKLSLSDSGKQFMISTDAPWDTIVENSNISHNGQFTTFEFNGNTYNTPRKTNNFLESFIPLE